MVSALERFQAHADEQDILIQAVDAEAYVVPIAGRQVFVIECPQTALNQEALNQEFNKISPNWLPSSFLELTSPLSLREQLLSLPTLPLYAQYLATLDQASHMSRQFDSLLTDQARKNNQPDSVHSSPVSQEPTAPTASVTDLQKSPLLLLSTLTRSGPKPPETLGTNFGGHPPMQGSVNVFPLLDFIHAPWDQIAPHSKAGMAALVHLTRAALLETKSAWVQPDGTPNSFWGPTETFGSQIWASTVDGRVVLSIIQATEAVSSSDWDAARERIEEQAHAFELLSSAQRINVGDFAEARDSGLNEAYLAKRLVSALHTPETYQNDDLFALSPAEITRLSTFVYQQDQLLADSVTSAPQRHWHI